MGKKTNIIFFEIIENYESSGKYLHMSKPRMRTLLYKSIILKKLGIKIFFERRR